MSCNASEYQAFRSGNALKNFLKTLLTLNPEFPPEGQVGFPDGVHLLAHSMGNVVVAEALRLYSVEHPSFSHPLGTTYVAMEGAISAGAYGDDSKGAKLSGALPDWDTDLLRYWTSGGANQADKEYMDFTGQKASKRVNMYNPDDAATSVAWRLNNAVEN